MRSVKVVLPASIWAMIPMFRYRSSVCCRGIESLPHASGDRDRHHLPFRLRKCGDGTPTACGLAVRSGALPVTDQAGVGGRPYPAGGLPAIVSEGLVGLRHLVRVLALLDGPTLVARGGQDLGRELLREGLIGA